MIDERWQQARRILVVRLDNLGDILVTTPAIHAIKASLPDAAITLLASPVGAQAGLLDPDLSDVIVYQAPWVDPWQQLPHDSGRERAMIETLRERRFDAAVIFTSYHQSSLPAAYLCYLADIPLRLAASIDGSGSLLTTRHRHPERLVHEVERGLDLVAAVGFTTDETDLVLRVPDSPHPPTPLYQCWERGAFRYPLPALGEGRPKAGVRAVPRVVVHPGCSMPARAYPAELYTEVIAQAVSELGATVMVTGTDDERALVQGIVDELPLSVRDSVQPLAGELPFAEFCGLIEAADLVITNNTGPMHVAAALKTPVIALFALTNPPEQWGPWHVPHRLLYHDVPCRLCYKRVCPTQQECLRSISPVEVIEAAAGLLDEVGARFSGLDPARTERLPRGGAVIAGVARE